MRLALAVSVAAIATGLVWIEHHHRIDIATPAGTAYAASAGAVCPDNDNVPYGADCLQFIQGDAAAPHPRPSVGSETSAHPGASDAAGPACPANNENVPYSARCIRFMSGWFWHLSTP